MNLFLPRKLLDTGPKLAKLTPDEHTNTRYHFSTVIPRVGRGYAI